MGRSGGGFDRNPEKLLSCRRPNRAQSIEDSSCILDIHIDIFLNDWGWDNRWPFRVSFLAVVITFYNLWLQNFETFGINIILFVLSLVKKWMFFEKFIIIFFILSICKLVKIMNFGTFEYFPWVLLKIKIKSRSNFVKSTKAHD